MKDKWLNLVLLLSNRIYQRKQKIIAATGLAAVGNIIVLIILEMLLGLISLPLYLGVKSKGINVFLKDKGSYAQINFDYNLRRVLTLTGAGIVLVLWLLKLVLMLAVPTFYGPLQLYRVTNLRPPDLLSAAEQSLVTADVGFQTARIVSTLRPPTLVGVKKETGGDYTFSGTGAPLSTVVLLLSDQQTAIYSDKVNSAGKWQLRHVQKDFRLRPGNHSVLVFNYDQLSGTRSDVSQEQYFKVTTSWFDQLLRNVDVLANWSVVLILLLGVLLTFLTI